MIVGGGFNIIMNPKQDKQGGLSPQKKGIVNVKIMVNDEFTTEFYIAFWHQIGSKLIETLYLAKDHDELSLSLRGTVITLLLKQGKNELEQS